MKFKLYETAKDYQAATGEILRKYEVQNNLFFRNIEMGLASDDNSNRLMATVADEDGHVLVCGIRTLPHPLLIFEADNQPRNDALALFAESLNDNGIEIDEFMTGKDLAGRFMDFNGRKTGKTFALRESLVLYQLDQVNPLDLPAGNFRPAAENDFYFLPYWYADFNPAADVGPYSLEGGIARAREDLDGKAVYIWEDGRPVSMAAVRRSVSDCAIIAPVYTPPFFREKGYATACVASLSQKLLDEGWRSCALYANYDNPYSNKVYLKIGYRAIFYHDHYQVHR